MWDMVQEIRLEVGEKIDERHDLPHPGSTVVELRNEKRETPLPVRSSRGEGEEYLLRPGIADKIV
jgi:hypothetical protein